MTSIEKKLSKGLLDIISSKFKDLAGKSDEFEDIASGSAMLPHTDGYVETGLLFGLSHDEIKDIIEYENDDLYFYIKGDPSSVDWFDAEYHLDNLFNRFFDNCVDLYVASRPYPYDFIQDVQDEVLINPADSSLELDSKSTKFKYIKKYWSIYTPRDVDNLLIDLYEVWTGDSYHDNLEESYRNIPTFDYFINEYHATQTFIHPMLGGYTPVDQTSFNNPSFQVKLHSVEANREKTEPRNNSVPLDAPLIRGTWIEVKSKGTGIKHYGRFISGQKDKKGKWIKIKMIDCENDLREIEPASLQLSSAPVDHECGIFENHEFIES